MIKLSFVFFCAGILVAAFTNIPFLSLWGSALVLLLLSVVFLNRKIGISTLLLCVFFLGAALLRNTQTLSPHHISNFTPAGKSTSVKIEGIVDTGPVYKASSVSFVLKTKRIIIEGKEYPCCGKLLAKIFKKEKFDYGESLILSGALYRVPYFKFSRKLNYREYLRQSGIYSMLSVKKDAPIKRIGENRGFFLKYFAFRIRGYMEKVIHANLPPLFANIFNAIILGKREGLSAGLKQIFIQTGTIHIIAISGLHLGIIAILTLIFLKIIRVPKKIGFIITMFILVVYCFMTGSRVPVIRATVMACILFLALLLERETDIYNSLALAAFVILFINPWQLFSVSFQLSFLSIISIVYFPPKIKRLFSHRMCSKKPLCYIIDAFTVSLGVWVGLTPLIAYYFGIISPVAILANVIVVPYLAIVIASGFSVLLASVILPAILPIISTSSEIAIFVLLKIVSFFSQVPGAYFRLPSIPFYIVVMYYLILVPCFKFLDNSRRS